jgi:hypothetical protein
MVYWIDYEGKEVYYTAINPGKSWDVSTFGTHPWVFKKECKTVVAVYLPQTTPTLVVDVNVDALKTYDSSKEVGRKCLMCEDGFVWESGSKCVKPATPPRTIYWYDDTNFYSGMNDISNEGFKDWNDLYAKVLAKFKTGNVQAAQAVWGGWFSSNTVY